jgi:protein-S-isoprenylcysteine O-methyltransferase Ste14
VGASTRQEELMSPIEVCKWMWMAWAGLWGLWALRTKRAQTRLNLSEALTYMVPTFPGVWIFFAPHRILVRVGLWWEAIPDIPWLMWLGAAMTLVGLLFAIWARLYLGKNWSGLVQVKHDHELIRTGPYRFVRHPIYAGILLALVGTSICRRNVWGFLGVALVGLGFWLKSRLEERFMVETFGAQYDDYRRATGALIPRLL